MKKLLFETLPDDHVVRLALIVLQSDITIEDEFRYYFSDLPVSLLVNRIPFENEVTVETLQQMEAHLATSMSLFPLDAEFDSLGYGCTSGALHIGNEAIANRVQQCRPCQTVTNPMQAAIRAMQHVGATNIAYLAPYSEAVSQTMIDRFEEKGINVAAAATFNENQDKMVGRIAPSSIQQAALDLADNDDVDAVFVSCTNMKCAHIIPVIESLSNKIALSSNQVLAWDMARQCGMAERIHNKGRLFGWKA